MKAIVFAGLGALFGAAAVILRKKLSAGRQTSQEPAGQPAEGTGGESAAGSDSP
jgi:hypothetical protein